MDKLQCAPIYISNSSPNNGIQVAVKSQNELVIIQQRRYLLSTATCLQHFQFFYFSRKTLKNQIREFDFIFGLFSWIGLQATASYIHIFRNKGPLIESYFGNLLEFTKIYPTGNVLTRNKNWNNLKFIGLANILLTHMLLITTVGFPPCYVLSLHWHKTCKP